MLRSLDLTAVPGAVRTVIWQRSNYLTGISADLWYELELVRLATDQRQDR